MYHHVYLTKNLVIVPTSGQAQRGLYRDIEPVEVAPVSDAAAIRRALQVAISRGNPPVGPYPRGSRPMPVVVKYAGVKSWGAFARHASPWSIHEKDGICRIVGKRMSRDGWVEDPDQTIKFPPKTPIDEIIDSMIAILQDTARNT